ncbi:hypothetical protein [Nocardioides terrisoli]|uniref:hypothetical protein n=1 Tax=Nocardioides terrisoli TaxID=3388267 RepID=UPI00287B89B1|nr:hypothetical protein [Nocardioides marmorisolisilvae]
MCGRTEGQLTGQGRWISLYLNDYLMVFGPIALIYVVTNNGVSALATWLEPRLARPGRAAASAVEDVEAVLPQG